MLNGQRIQLRVFRPDEFEMVRGWFDDPKKVAGPHQPYWDGIGDQVIESLQVDLNPGDQGGRFAIELLDSGKVIGTIRYYAVSLAQQFVSFYEIGYAITDLSERRKGYATEACALLIDYVFDTFAVRRIGASTLGANEPSARLLESLGFVHEGSIRQAVYNQSTDDWTDYFWYGLLREEWMARRGA
jgi:RimJ/RimL family protein N-acetyltransferase